MIRAVAYARVSSREQEREGYSIPAQRKLLAEYARSRRLLVEREFIDVESAKNPGRKEFGHMLGLLGSGGAPPRLVLVEKTASIGTVPTPTYRKPFDLIFSAGKK